MGDFGLVWPRGLGMGLAAASSKSVDTATALMQEALEILDSCEALVPAVHLWTALQALNALNGQATALVGEMPQPVRSK